MGRDVTGRERTHRPRRLHGPVASAVLCLLLAAGLTVTACSGGTTAEISASSGWGVVAEESPGAGSAAADGPQLVPEITLPDGGVPTVPQPTVPPAAPPPTVAAATTVATPAGTTPPVLAAPGATTDVPPVSVEVPDPVPGGARALERLDSDRQRQVAAQALGRIRFDWRRTLPGWQVRFLPGRSGYRGSTFPDSKVIEIYVRDGDRPEGLSHVVAHEMGHAVDVSRLGPVQREAWKAARGIPADVPWFPGESGATDYATGAGDFAESFARWQSGVDWYSQLGPPPNPVQTGLLAALSGLA